MQLLVLTSSGVDYTSPVTHGHVFKAALETPNNVEQHNNE